MASEYKPVALQKPRVADRKREKPRPAPLSQEIIARRKLIATALLEKIEPVSNTLKQMSDDERKVVFFKLEHEGKIDLTGTGLKAISDPSDSITLAIPKESNLDRLESKIDKFAESDPDRNGMLPHGALVSHLKTIKKGSPKDRLCGDFFSRYKDLVKKRFLIYEIELLTLKTGTKQQKEELAKFRLEIDGVLRTDSLGAVFEHSDSKGTCRMVIRSSGATFKKLVEEQPWQRKIVFFDSRPKFQTFFETFKNYQATNLGLIGSPAADAPTVCIVDSGVSIGNPFLKPVSKEDLFKSFLKKSPNDPSDEFGHGSGVASLASYYALDISDGAQNSGKLWIANARVLDEHNYSEDDKDSDEGRLFSEVIKEVVRTFAPLGIKIFNLAVNDENRRWDDENRKLLPRKSWVARTIDFLSREYDVVFVISTGNLFKNQVRGYIEEGIDYPKYLTDPRSRLLDPAQSALAITVGSVAHSVTIVGPNSAGDSVISKLEFPSPFTRRGPGINGEIKPEVVERGGNYILTSSGGVSTNVGTDVIMASKDASPSLTNMSGTSFAVPRVCHSLGMIHQNLSEIQVRPSAPLLRALLVNSSAHPEDSVLTEFLSGLEPERAEEWLNIYGYGIPDRRRAVEADPYSALLYFQGTLKPNKVAFLSVPVPIDLAYAERGLKRMTVTMAYSPEVQRWGLERYFGAVLKWRMFRGDIEQSAVVDAMSAEDTGDETYRQSLDQELTFSPGITLRSKGALQHATFDWTNHHEEYSQNHYTLAIGSYEQWNRKNGGEIPYAVVVRIEDLSKSCRVYSLVNSMIEISV